MPQSRGEWPILCLDDLASELDEDHQAALVNHLSAVDAQVLVTGTHTSAALETTKACRFHVEQGAVARLL